MSFSNPRIENPAKKFIEFKGKTGKWVYYDKEQGKEIDVQTPFYFVVLDELSCMRGYSDQLKSGLYSNEVHSLVKEKLTVRSFIGNFETTGFYADIKDSVKAKGGKFAKSVYALMLSKDGHEIVVLRLQGAAFNVWFDLRFNQRKHIIVAKDEVEEKTKGTNKYKVPVFALMNMPEDVVSFAEEKDCELQRFFQSRKSEAVEEIEASTAQSEPDEDPMDMGNWEEMPIDKMPKNAYNEDDSDLPF